MCQASTDSEASVFGIIGPNPLFIIYTYLFVNVSYKWIWTSFGELQVIKNKPKLIRGRHFSSRIDFIFLLVAPLGRLMYAFIFCLPSHQIHPYQLVHAKFVEAALDSCRKCFPMLVFHCPQYAVLI